MKLCAKTLSTSAKAIFVSATLIATSVANAGFQCNAQLNAVLVYSNGAVNINHTGRGDYTHVCNLNTVYKGVPTAVCAAWTALLLQTKKTSGTLQFYYDGTGTCATLALYENAPAPLYIGLTN